MPDSMHKLDDSETVMLFLQALRKVSPGVLQDMQRGTHDARDRGLKAAARIVADHLKLSRHEIYRPETKGGPLFG